MTMKLSPTQIQEIAERAEKATKGPWRVRRLRGMDNQMYIHADNPANPAQNIEVFGEDYPSNIDSREDDFEFGAHARTDIPALLAHIAAQDGEIARLERERDEANSNLSSAYLYITNGMLGKPNSDPMAVRAIGDDIATKLVEDETARLAARIAQLESQIAVKDGALKAGDALWDQVHHALDQMIGMNESAIEDVKVRLQDAWEAYAKVVDPTFQP